MDNIKIKPLTKEQLIISIDRLTRFKRGKYLRVFCDILTSNLISPKYKKYEIEDMEPEKLRDLAQYVINFSLENLGYVCDGDLSLNKKILDYENYMEKARVEYSLGFPVKEVIIVEGATEEILLPEFAKICGYDFDKEGIYVISAGGKNQVVKMYYKLVEYLKLPIFVLLDKDAKENLEEIIPRLRKIDRIHLLECGEFEDLLTHDLINRTIEYEFSNISIIEKDLLNSDEPRTKVLEEFFRTRGMHEFKKAEFAGMVKNNIKSTSDVSPEIMRIIEEIKR